MSFAIKVQFRKKNYTHSNIIVFHDLLVYLIQKMIYLLISMQNLKDSR